MAWSDANESRVQILDLSDEIDAELSEEGGNICQAEGSLSVQPKRHEPYRPYSDGEAVKNEQPGGVEGGRYMEMTKISGEVRKTNRINEY